MLTRKYTWKPGNSISSQQKPISISLCLNQASCLVSSLQRSIISVLLWVSLRQWQGNHIGKFHTSHTSLSGFLLSWHQAPISFCNWRLPQPYLVARYPECTYSNRFGVMFAVLPHIGCEPSWVHQVPLSDFLVHWHMGHWTTVCIGACKHRAHMHQGKTCYAVANKRQMHSSCRVLSTGIASALDGQIGSL